MRNNFHNKLFKRIQGKEYYFVIDTNTFVIFWDKGPKLHKVVYDIGEYLNFSSEYREVSVDALSAEERKKLLSILL